MKFTAVCLILWILGPINTVDSRNRLGFRVIMPKSAKFKGGNYVGAAKRDLRRELFGFDVQLIEMNSNSPQEIFQMFCNDVLPNNVTSVLYLHVKDGISARRASEYVMNVIQNIGIPLMAWDPGFEGALENQRTKRTVQLSATIYHQAELMVKLLHSYNWTYFSIVTTSTVNSFDFVNAINGLVQENNEYSGSVRKQRLTLVSQIIIPHGVETQEEITDYLEEHNHVDSRIYLLHASSRDTKDILDAAKTLNLTGSEFLWILSATSVDVPLFRSPPSFPLGTFGVTHRGEFRANEEISEVEATIKAGMEIWANVMKTMKTRGYSIGQLTLDFACNSNTSLDKWDVGDEIYRNILTSKSTGDKYSVEFSEKGVNKLVKLNILNVQMKQERGQEFPAFRKIGEWYPKIKKTFRSQTVNMTLKMNDITWPGGKSYPPKGRPARRFFRIATLDEAPYVTYAAPDRLTRLCRSPAVPCRLVNDARFKKDDPANLASDGTRHWCCAGLSIDLLKILSERMAFDYDLFEVPDRTSGVQNEYTGLWNGLIRILQDGNADMVMTALTITPKRSEYIDMSMPYLETGTTIVVSLRKGAISPTAVLEPYDYPSWCLILVFSVHSIGASIFIFEWLSPRGLDQGKTPMREHTFSLFRSFWLIWAMLFGASVSADNPRGVSSRFLANVWALFALVFLASYTANLAAFMITKEVYYDLSGIKDWRLTNPESHKPPFRFATVPNGSTEENLRQNHNRMFSYMKKYNQPSVKEAVKALKNGDIQAFIYDATPLEYQIGIDPSCHLISVGKWYAMTGYAVGLPKGSSALVEEINKIILHLQDIGELDRLRKFWLAGACHSKTKSGQSSHQLGILNFTSAFILLASGIVLGGLLLILEHLYFRFGRKCLKQYDTCGCCALVSLSMGKSLTFEQSVMEAIDFRKKYRCKDPLCETQLWKVKHQLDLALLRIDKLNKEIRKDKAAARQAIKGPDEDEDDEMMKKQREVEEEDKNPMHDDPNSYPEKSEIVNEDVNNVRHSDRSMRRSPSYNQAVSKDNDDNEEVNINSRKRYSDGKCYSSVGDAEV